MSLLAALLFAGLTANGCGIVDPEPAEIEEKTITPYYYDFNHGTEYTYWVSDPKFSQAPYAVKMEMEGEKYGCTYPVGDPQAKQVFECDWHVSGYTGGDYYGYYAVDSLSAHYMGSKLNPTYPVWLDMVAPIKKGQQWSFPYGMEAEKNVINATITRVGFTCFVPDSLGAQRKFEDVIEVEYLSKEEKIVKWFARGIGMIAEWQYDLTGKIVVTKSLLQKESDD
jgi:hypothetical protein